MTPGAPAATVGRMGNRKRNAGKPQKPGSDVLYVRMPPKLHAAFERFLKEDPTEPKRQQTGVDALVMFLTAKGFWPPKDAK
jgi:hypothetical protein